MNQDFTPARPFVLKQDGPIDINIHVHFHHHDEDGQQNAKLDNLAKTLSRIGKLIMATADEFKIALAKVEVATTAIGARLQKYIDDKNAGGMTAAEETAALAQLGVLATSLETMGKDPANPVPDPLPPVEI